ncbi:T9SS type A sorting domain-containing protein [candidate division GN15 bacterium]|nr:T9SS type A sorting domain-containing protein [candidate division GN15 bacterium]
MRLCLVVILGISLLISGAVAEAPDVEWDEAFGRSDADYAYWVEETDDLGFILTGWSYVGPYHNGEDDMYVVKTDRFGNLIWDQTYGDSLMDRATHILPLDQGGYLLCGYSNSYPPGGTDIRVLRLGFGGTSLWTKEYGADTSADYAYTISPLNDGNYLITGNGSHLGWYFLKIDSSGNVLNEVCVDRPQDVHQAVATADGGAIAIGGSTQLFLVKLNAFGDTTWTRGYGGDSFGTSVIEMPEGGYAAFGFKRYSLLDDQFWLLRLDNDGDTLWTRHYGYQYNDQGWSVCRTYDGGFVMTGSMYPSNGSDERQMWIVRTDSLGDTLWTQTVGGTGVEIGQCIRQTSDSGYVVAGWTTSYGEGYYDYYLVKLEADPELVTDVAENEFILPSDIALNQNYPNPFNPATTITFSLPRKEDVTIDVFNVLGQRVRTITSSEYPAGTHRVEWDGSDESGRSAASGVYFYRLTTGSRTIAKKMQLVR